MYVSSSIYFGRGRSTELLFVLFGYFMVSTQMQGAQNFSMSPVPSVEKAYYLASHMLPPRLLVVHNTRRSCEDDVSELTRGEKLHDPLLEIGDADVVAWRYDACFVDPRTC